MEGILKKSIEPEEIKRLQQQIEACCRQGAAYAGQEDFTAAEQAYLRALKQTQLLLEKTGDSGYGSAAGELCEILADIHMQQGNMHGADRYYVEAQRFRRKEGWPDAREDRRQENGT